MKKIYMVRGFELLPAKESEWDVKAFEKLADANAYCTHLNERSHDGVFYEVKPIEVHS